MSEKKVIYSKRFPKESFAELSEETKQLNKEAKMNDDIPEGEHILDFLERNRKVVPNEERIAGLFFMICVNTENGIKYRMVIGLVRRKAAYCP